MRSDALRPRQPSEAGGRKLREVYVKQHMPKTVLVGFQNKTHFFSYKHLNLNVVPPEQPLQGSLFV